MAKAKKTMPMSHKSVPVIVLHHNPKVRTSDKESAGSLRGQTNLPQDTAGYGTQKTRP